MTKKKKIKHLQKSLDAQAVIIAGYQDRNQKLFDEVKKYRALIEKLAAIIGKSYGPEFIYRPITTN